MVFFIIIPFRLFKPTSWVSQTDKLAHWKPHAEPVWLSSFWALQPTKPRYWRISKAGLYPLGQLPRWKRCAELSMGGRYLCADERSIAHALFHSACANAWMKAHSRCASSLVMSRGITTWAR